MFPLRDDNPTLSNPYVTIGLLGLNILAWLGLQGAGSEPWLTRSVCGFGLIPGELLGIAPNGLQVQVGPDAVCEINHASASWLTPIYSMFLHGGWLHLLGNMWFLWVFGNNVEDSMGRVRYLAFYLMCGLAAAAAQTFANPASPIPMVGASGAIGGVMGAYLSLFPWARVDMLIILGFYVTRAAVPAMFMLGYWFVLQSLGGIPRMSPEGGVAFWAHVGGFVSGFLLSCVFRDQERVAAHRRLAGSRLH